jgi:hypothetical protein
MSTNNFHTRINDHALSFGIQRYATGIKETDDSLWKLIISDYCGVKKHASIEVSIQDIICLKNFCEKALEELKTDGGRK